MASVGGTSRSVSPLSYADRWMRDGLQESGRVGASVTLEVDVTQASARLQRHKSSGAPITWTHVFVRCVALALGEKSLHRVVAGNSRWESPPIDICLSLNDDHALTPVLIIKDADKKDLSTLSDEIRTRAPEALQKSEQLRVWLDRFGWIIPFAWTRRRLVRFLLNRVAYRTAVSGTFQITGLAGADVFAPMIFNTAAILGIGGVKERVVAVNGQPVVRSTVFLTCCIDHAQWNGMTASVFLESLAGILGSADF